MTELNELTASELDCVAAAEGSESTPIPPCTPPYTTGVRIEDLLHPIIIVVGN